MPLQASIPLIRTDLPEFPSSRAVLPQLHLLSVEVEPRVVEVLLFTVCEASRLLTASLPSAPFPSDLSALCPLSLDLLPAP